MFICRLLPFNRTILNVVLNAGTSIHSMSHGQFSVSFSRITSKEIVKRFYYNITIIKCINDQLKCYHSRISNGKATMISTRTMLLMALTLFAAGPIVAEHQAFAAHHSPYKVPTTLATLMIWAKSATGPCFQGKFSYTFCLKKL